MSPGRSLSAKKAAAVKPGMWQRMRTGSATKGAKDYDWAMIEVLPDETPAGQDDGHAFLLLRKHRYTGTVSYYLCWSPAPVPLAKLISVAVARWRIEEDHQQSKQVSGLGTTSLCLRIWPIPLAGSGHKLVKSGTARRARRAAAPRLSRSLQLNPTILALS